MQTNLPMCDQSFQKHGSYSDEPKFGNRKLPTQNDFLVIMSIIITSDRFLEMILTR